jgi:uncharacterized protein (DUF169 family)
MNDSMQPEAGTREAVGTLDEAIAQYLRPATFPLAIAMLKDAGDIPSRARRPGRDSGGKLTTCQAIGICRRQGHTIALAREDIACPNAAFFLGYAKPPDDYWQGRFPFTPFNQSEEARATRSRSLAFFPPGEFKALLIAPLASAAFEPDIVLVYGRPAQMMRLVQAATFRTGEPLELSASGGGSCSMEIVKPILEQKVALVLPGNGERIFGLVQDDEMAFSIPRKWIGEIAAGLKATHEGGQRYPVPAFASATPPMPPSYDALLRSLDKED